MLLKDIIAIRERCETEAEKAKIDAAVDVIGDTFLKMVQSFEDKAAGKGGAPASLNAAREALDIIREKDTENIVPVFETDGALAVFIIRFAREIIENRG